MSELTVFNEDSDAPIIFGADAQEETRQRWRNLSLNSTWFMSFVCGFYDLSVQLHFAMCNWIQCSEGDRLLGLVPRDHLKTSIWTIADSVRILSGDPLARILIENEVAENAENMMYRIRRVAEANALWQWLFPERIPDFNGKWNSTGLVFPRDEEYVEPTVSALGVGSSATSRHFTHIKEDDLIGKEASNSHVKMLEAIDQHKLAEHLIVDPATSIIQTYGTRWAPDDLYSWIIENEPTIKKFILGVYGIDANGVPVSFSNQPIWSRFTVDYLEGLRKKNGNYMFALQMLNKPIGKGVSELQSSWLNYYDLLPQQDMNSSEVIILHREGDTDTYSLDECSVFEITDPGLSPESTSARTAVLTFAITPANPFDIVILGAEAHKLSPKGCIDLAHQEWDRWQPIHNSIEVVAAQRTFLYWIPTVYPTMSVRPLKTSTHIAKKNRIRSFGPFAQQGRVFIRKEMHDFIKEWEDFPNGETVDLLDCCGYAPQVWAAPQPGQVRGRFRPRFEYAEDNRQESFGKGRNLVTGY
jgi:hypothetical protein